MATSTHADLARFVAYTTEQGECALYLRALADSHINLLHYGAFSYSDLIFPMMGFITIFGTKRHISSGYECVFCIDNLQQSMNQCK